MTRTEDDVRAVLLAEEDDAPDAGEALARLNRAMAARRHRRIAVGATLTAAAVAVAVVVPAVWSAHREAAPVGERSSSPTENPPVWLDFTVQPPEGYRLLSREIEAGFRRIGLFHVGTSATISVSVFDRGIHGAEFEALRTRTESPVDVGGRAGFYTADATSDGLPVRGRGALVWEYAPDSWAVVQSGLPPAATPEPPPEVLAVANGTRFGEHRSLRVPYRFGYLPDGLRPVYGAEIESITGTNEAYSHVEYARQPADRANRGGFVDLDGGRVPSGSGLIVKVEERGPSDPRTPDELIGRPTYPGPGTVVVEYVGYRLEIVVAHDDLDRYDQPELERIITGMTFAPNVADVSTWFDLAS